jgi:hypothetical protein
MSSRVVGLVSLLRLVSEFADELARPQALYRLNAATVNRLTDTMPRTNSPFFMFSHLRM